MIKNNPFDHDFLSQQIVNISKASAYDIVVPSLQEENKKLKERVKYLENLIDEYSLKMKVSLSGWKVDEFLKEQVNDIPEQLFTSPDTHKEPGTEFF